MLGESAGLRLLALRSAVQFGEVGLAKARAAKADRAAPERKSRRRTVIAVAAGVVALVGGAARALASPTSPNWTAERRASRPSPLVP